MTPLWDQVRLWQRPCLWKVEGGGAWFLLSLALVTPSIWHEKPSDRILWIFWLYVLSSVAPISHIFCVIVVSSRVGASFRSSWECLLAFIAIPLIYLSELVVWAKLFTVLVSPVFSSLVFTSACTLGKMMEPRHRQSYHLWYISCDLLIMSRTQ